MLEQLVINEFGNTKTKLDTCVDRIKFFAPIAERTGGYYVNFSGGKDSLLIELMMKLAGVKYELHYNITGIDPPEVVYFIREHGNVIMHQHKESFFQVVERKLRPPTRRNRFCCPELKEHGGEGKFNVTGVRWAESSRRKKGRQVIEYDRYGSEKKKSKEGRREFFLADNDEKRRILETGVAPNGCKTTGKNILNPAADIEDYEVWDILKYYNVKYPGLYDEGFKRIGCIGCPKATKSNREREFKRWPKFKENYIKCFDRMIKHRLELEKPTTWKSGEEVFEWWMKY